MIRNFKFFHGIVHHTLTAHWNPELIDDLNAVHAIDAEAELTRLMSEEIARAVDDDIINRITRIMNNDSNEIQRNIDYLNHYLDMGGQRA